MPRGIRLPGVRGPRASQPDERSTDDERSERYATRLGRLFNEPESDLDATPRPAYDGPERRAAVRPDRTKGA